MAQQLVGITTDETKVYAPSTMAALRSTQQQIIDTARLWPTERAFDAHAMFSFLSVREIRKQGETEQVDVFDWLAKLHALLVQQTGKWDSILTNLQLVTSVDIRNYGKTLVRPEFQDE